MNMMTIYYWIIAWTHLDLLPVPGVYEHLLWLNLRLVQDIELNLEIRIMFIM